MISKIEAMKPICVHTCSLGLFRDSGCSDHYSHVGGRLEMSNWESGQSTSHRMGRPFCGASLRFARLPVAPWVCVLVVAWIVAVSRDANDVSNVRGSD